MDVKNKKKYISWKKTVKIFTHHQTKMIENNHQSQKKTPNYHRQTEPNRPPHRKFAEKRPSEKP